jgi:hypothetical protein
LKRALVRLSAETAIGTLLDKVQEIYPDVTAVDIMPLLRKWVDDVLQVRIADAMELVGYGSRRTKRG